ncbi:MAG: nuclear transport factor 2 family protein [Hyphomicrobiaceae bacterium]
MPEEHPNIALFKGMNPSDLPNATDLFAPNVVFHYINPRLPNIHGDYVGMEGIRSFFEKLGAVTAETFRVEPISISAMGDELVVMHNRNRLTLDGQPIETDVVLVWRIVDGRVVEVWDIPSVGMGPSPAEG